MLFWYLLASFGNPMQSPLRHGTVWMVPPFPSPGHLLKKSRVHDLEAPRWAAIVHIEPNIFVGFPGCSLVPLGVLDFAKLDLDSQVDSFSGFPTKTTPSMVKEVSAMLVATWYHAAKLRICKIHPLWTVHSLSPFPQTCNKVLQKFFQCRTVKSDLSVLVSSWFRQNKHVQNGRKVLLGVTFYSHQVGTKLDPWGFRRWSFVSPPALLETHAWQLRQVSPEKNTLRQVSQLAKRFAVCKWSKPIAGVLLEW